MTKEHLKNEITTSNSYQKETLSLELATLKEQHKDLGLRYNALFSINKLSQECEDLNSFYPKVHTTITSLMTAENFYIVIYDQNLSTLEFVYYVDKKDEKPKGIIDYDDLVGSFTHLVIESSQPQLLNPSLKEKKHEHKVTHGSLGTGWLGVPLMHNELVIGVMVVQTYDEEVIYTEQDLNLLTFAGQHVVGAMVRLQDKVRLTSAVNARTKELTAQMREREKSELLQASLYRISELTNDVSCDINLFYAQVHNIVGQLINATNFFIAKYDEKKDTIEYVYVVDEALKHQHNLATERKLAGHYSELVIRRQKSVLLTKQDMQDLFSSGQSREPNLGEHSWLGVPLHYSEKLLGVMVIQSYTENTIYNQEDAELLNFVSTHVSSAIKRREIFEIEKQNHELLEGQVKLRTLALEEEVAQRKQAEQKLQHRASHDSLTGLPNRMVFQNLVNRAIACNKRRDDLFFAILFLDLDRFKMVNDSLGHQAGDILLKLVAQKLFSILRGKDTVARLGGDEFVILIENLKSEKKAFDIAQRITEFLTEPFVINNQVIFIGTSIGVLFSHERYQDADTMLRDADTAMYHAKGNGKGRYEVFDASMHNKVQNALSLEADIREAIELEEFTPYYQPIIKLDSDEIQGFEALARWPSIKRGLVLPDEFIPLAEETNLVQAIDFQILKKSCQQLKVWQDTFSCYELYVSCNLFCHQFLSATLADDIEHILRETGLEPKHLRVELTERALLENADIVLSNMKALKRLGVQILLDDFGTGYSSLSYLHQFPIDVLKIDRSFINNFHEKNSSRAIIKTIIDLATSLGMETIGEGIESFENAQLLQKMDCLYGQGFYYAKPMPAHEAKQYINAH